VARLAASQAYGADFGGWSTVLVGDTPLDVEAALAAGARVVGVATGSYSEEELAAAGAHAVLPDLTDPVRVRAVVTGALLAWRGYQAAFDRGGHRGRAAGHPQLGERAQQVRLHRRLADEQLTADLGVGATACDVGQDLGFPARDLAIDLLAAYQGNALLANTLRDPKILSEAARRLERWIDAL
jgi:hypothetical protein